MHSLTRRGAILSAGASLAAACCTKPPVIEAPAHSEVIWAPGQPPLLFAVQEIYPAAHQDRIHIAGGLLSDGTRVTGVSDRHIAYASGGVANELAPLPARRHHPYAVSHKGKLYLLGGFGSDPDHITWVMSTDTLVFSTSGDTEANGKSYPGSWLPLAPAPEPHAEVVAAAIGDHIHIVGGRRPKGDANAAYGDHEDVDRHLVFDPAANAWSKAAPALSARNSAAGALISGLWHVVGGRSVANGPTDAHEVYAPQEDRWRNAAPMPKGSGAGGNAAAVLRDTLYVFGGEYFTGGQGGVHAEVWAYDPKTDAWTEVGKMPTPRHGLGAVTLNRSIWLVGGAKRPSGSETSNAVERFQLGG
ncbi:MAG: kelch repeat-containing protein [Hyphomonadaceae bacterium]|nr:kelch repeat-containing protein [Hyphomonadaceae bacterium]